MTERTTERAIDVAQATADRVQIIKDKVAGPVERRRGRMFKWAAALGVGGIALMAPAARDTVAVIREGAPRMFDNATTMMALAQQLKDGELTGDLPEDYRFTDERACDDGSGVVGNHLCADDQAPLSREPLQSKGPSHSDMILAVAGFAVARGAVELLEEARAYPNAETLRQLRELGV